MNKSSQKLRWGWHKGAIGSQGGSSHDLHGATPIDWSKTRNHSDSICIWKYEGAWAVDRSVSLKKHLHPTNQQRRFLQRGLENEYVQK